MTNQKKKKKKSIIRRKIKIKNPVGRPKKEVKIKVKKPAGRPRLSYSFDESRLLIQREGLASVGDYTKWWAMNQPARMPKRPDRAYKKVWISWNHFLGLNNQYPFRKIRYKKFEDARAFARSLGFKHKNEWVSYAMAGNLPFDVPRRPDFVYRKSTRYDEYGGEWYTWPDWLGTNTIDRLQQIRSNITVLLIVTKTDFINGTYGFVIINGSTDTIKQEIIDNKYRLIKGYIVEMYDWAAILKQHFVEYGNGIYLIQNINQLLYHYDLNMRMLTL
jgi:hypothetical protein